MEGAARGGLSFGDEDDRGRRVRAALEEILTDLGDVYCSLAGTNGALGALNKDVEGCIRHVVRTSQRGVEEEVATAPREVIDARATDALRGEEPGEDGILAVSDEIEAILAKARRVVTTTIGTKSKAVRGDGSARSQNKSSADGDSEAAKRRAPASPRAAHRSQQPPRPPTTERRAPPAEQPAAGVRASVRRPRWPADLRRLRHEAVQSLRDLARRDDIDDIVAAPGAFNRDMLELAHTVGAGGSGQHAGGAAVGDGGTSLLGALRRLIRRECDLLTQFSQADQMDTTGAAMLREAVSAMRRERGRLARQFGALGAYGGAWAEAAGLEAADTPPREDGGAFGTATGGGLRDALSLAWLPPRLGAEAAAAMAEAGGDANGLTRVLGAESARVGAAAVGVAAGRHAEALARARTRLQQKMLQMHVEMRLRPILPPDPRSGDGRGAGGAGGAASRMRVRDAVALERWIAACRLPPLLSVEARQREPGFFFREAAAGGARARQPSHEGGRKAAAGAMADAGQGGGGAKANQLNAVHV